MERRRLAGKRYGIAIFLGHAKRWREFRTLHAGCVIPVKLSAEQPISKQRLVVSRAGGERAQDASIAGVLALGTEPGAPQDNRGVVTSAP